MKKGKMDLAQVCRAIENDPYAVVAEAEAHYSSFIERAAEEIDGKHNVILLSGPSSSGKTTSAKRIKNKLAEKGHNTHIISMDDFFRQQDEIPLLPNGNKDWDSLNTLDIDLLNTTLKSLTEGKITPMPTFDFTTKSRKDATYELQLKKSDVVIMEGIHALNPLVDDELPKGLTYKVYIDVAREFEELSWRDMRFIRRMVRDEKFRAYLAISTAKIWSSVVEAEEQFVIPYIDNANIIVDSSQTYEISLLKNESVKCLETLLGTEFEDYAKRLLEVVKKVPSMPADAVPKNAVMREFLGGLEI